MFSLLIFCWGYLFLSSWEMLICNVCVCVCEFSLPGSDIRVMWTLKNGLRSIPLSSILRKHLRIVIKSLGVLLNLSVKPYGPKLLFWGRFLNTVAISLLIISLFGFSNSSWFRLGRLIIRRIYIFLLNFTRCWCVSIHNICLEFLFVSVIRSDQISHSVVSDSLWPHESQHTRPTCPSPTPRVHSDSLPLSWWCHPAISSSVVPFSFCPQSLPASESFLMSQLSASGGQSTGVSASASFLPKKSQGWSP